MKWCALFILFALVVSCTEKITDTGAVPYAEAGNNITTNLGCIVTLDASASRSNNSKLPFFTWSESASNPAPVVYDKFSTQTTLFFSMPGEYKMYLKVYNGENFSAPDSVRISVNPQKAGLIEDYRIEYAIRENISEPAADITREHLQRVNSITAGTSLNSVMSIKGVEYCTNLTRLSIFARGSLDLSLIANPAMLKEVYIISILGLQNPEVFQSCTALTRIDIEAPNFYSLDLIQNSLNLEWIKIWSSGLTDISALVNFHKTNYIGLDNNNINDISVLKSYSDFKIISLYSNKITNIKVLTENTKLNSSHTISLRSNPLDTISVDFYIPALLARGIHVYY